MNILTNLSKWQIASLGMFVLIVIAGIYLSLTNGSGQSASGQQAGVLYGQATPSPSKSAPTPSPSPQQIVSNYLVTIQTNYGNVVFETYYSDAPKAVENFVTLAKKGFYDNLIFHRVIKGFMIQGGDPDGTGTGGPDYTFQDELNPESPSAKEGYKKGVVAMANRGPDTNGSQFFIMLEDFTYQMLPYNYTIFGKVVQGQEIIDKIGTMQTGANDKPVKAVTMKSVTVKEKKTQ